MNQKFFENYLDSETVNTKRIINTPGSFTKNNFLYVQEAGYLKSKKPHLSQRKSLDSYLYIIIISGSGRITYNEHTVNAGMGDAFLIDCHNNYSHISSSDNPWELLWIHYNGSQASSYYSFFTSQCQWHFHPPQGDEIASLIHTIIGELTDKSEQTDFLCSGWILNILGLSLKKAQNQPNPLQEKLKAALHYLDSHYMESVRLEHVSEACFISKYYLSREFKKEYGITITQYLLTKRITKAKELLRYSTLSIEEIAIYCGIDDPSYFNRIFKKLEGCTASQYRNKW